MSVLKSALAVLALAWFPNCAVADDSAYRAAKVAIEKAKSCDDDAATAFSRLTDESAEIVARAAFEKCLTVWQNANRVYFEEREKNDRPPATEEQMRKNPYILSFSVKALNEDTEENSIENWKRPEIERLLVVIMDARLKSKPTN
jgi:hypothetical protein